MKKVTSASIVKSIMNELKKSNSVEWYLLSDGNVNALCENDVRAYNSLVREVISKLKSSSKVFSVMEEKDNQIVGSNFWNRVSYTYKLTILSKPCKEFLSLNNWLGKYADRKLKPEEVRDEDVSGKRSSYSVDYSSYLMHRPAVCKSTLEALRKARGTKDKIILKSNYNMYWGDRFNSYGEDMECEWNGNCSHFVDVTIKTPTGRIKKQMQITAY